MRRFVRAGAFLLTVSVLLCAVGCTGLDAGGTADQTQTFAADFLRQVVAALVL